ncbi:DUF1553 domain-containing protein [Roseimaritima ulvae]|uniref:Planctomycete cytochrome C n=1 Tax=Roseimaritima ulvae TaxID=980254 RepID=A0A5B9QMU1_9BACT|nr:DUF1553 domain-containing protein [Roseimaritima ulvae]QEG39182.1 Planctomycete cytochrome C [Roseimaritima ulvae]
MSNLGFAGRLGTHAYRTVTALTLGLWAVSSTVHGSDPSTLDFNRDIRPILSANCFACHGPDEAHREADLRLDTYAGVFTDREYDPVIVPGKPDESPLLSRVRSHDPDEVMPPNEHGEQLPAEQIELLRRWIDEGASWGEHWAFVPPRRPSLPDVSTPDWSRSPIDRFVLAELERQQRSPNPQARRADLLRRVSLDLTGLLPTPEEVDAFVSDTSADAYEDAVDRLLDSPRYGEHRARYWMDYARYGDTQGLHVDNYQHRWPYRDYVIRAFNDDMPYDQFTREQLAGDLLPPERLDQIVATGLIRCGISTGEGGTIIEELKANLARERAEMFGAVYLGLTTGCAACHDHKYDPLSQRDFYALTAFFNNLTEKASCDDRADWPPNVTVPKPDNAAAYDKVLAQKADVLRQLQQRRQRADQLITAWLQAGNRPTAVADKGLQLRLRLDENYKSGQPNKTLLHNTAPGTDSPEFTATGPAPQWGDDTCLWPSFRLDTNTRVNLGQTGDFEKDQAFSCGGWIKPRNVPGGKAWNTKAGALIAKMDIASGYRGWNLYYSGGPLHVQLIHQWPQNLISLETVGTTEYRSPFRLPEGSYEGTDPNVTLPRGGWAHVCFTYDGSGTAAGVKIYVNGQLQKTKVVGDALSGSIRTPAPMWLGRRHDGDPMQATAYQDMRIYNRELSAAEVARLPREDYAAEIIATKQPDAWTLDERKLVEDYFFDTVDAESIALQEQLPALDAELVRLSAGGAISLVCREKTGLAYADVLSRGVFNARAERVLADVPRFLPPLPPDAPHNRLGLAEWVVSPDNPLTARVTVNRVWQELFGTGLVATSDDFGTVGSPPSHRELLDWLAVEFVDSGWRVKQLYKTIVMSATYQQSAVATAELATTDADNRLLARGPRFRMDGEMLRDCALQASGLLVEKLGGKSVKPYQPPGVWETGSYGGSNTRIYKQDHGDNLYRRSLYTFVKRMAPMPNLEAFDATDRSATCVRRQRTNTPLAALVLMNDPQYLEAARHLGERAIREGGTSTAKRIDFLGRVLLSRSFSDADQKILHAAFDRLTASFADNPSDAEALISIGESSNQSVPDQPSLTTGKPSRSPQHQAGHPPSLANDGLRSDTNRFWSLDSSGGKPAWWEVDLETPTEVASVVVVGYYGDSRHYGFTVETSLDGQQWDLVADHRDNQQPSTAAGIRCEFEPRQVRFIRVNQTHNSANVGRHLVEVLAFGEPQPVAKSNGIDATELAVWMMLASTVMNSDAAINK